MCFVVIFCVYRVFVVGVKVLKEIFLCYGFEFELDIDMEVIFKFVKFVYDFLIEEIKVVCGNGELYGFCYLNFVEVYLLCRFCMIYI